MIGWYAHHHGFGHLTRARSVIPHLREDVTLFSSRPGEDVVRLPMDVDAPRSAAAAAAPDPVNLHYAPLGVEGIRRRMTILANWVDEHDPELFVVDVSVEVAALLRLLSVPTAVVRQHGRRDDPAHMMAYANASLLLAPYPEWLEEPWVPQWMRSKTSYSGGFSRFDHHLTAPVEPTTVNGRGNGERLVVVLDGVGGSCAWPVTEADDAAAGWRWVVLGGDARDGDRNRGWVSDPYPWLPAADVIVAHAGHNAVMEAAAARRPMIVIPHDRPFDEQRGKARALARAGVAHVEERWPDACRWPQLLEQVAATSTEGAARLVDGAGAARAAAALSEVARQHRGQLARA